MIFDIEDLKDKKRVLLIFSPSDEKDIFQWQMQEINSFKAGIEDRDMEIITVVEEGESKLNEQVLNEEEEQVLRKKFNVKSREYVAILLGKDGTVKFKDDKPVAMEDIFAIIDAMPQRKKEMEERRRNSL